MRSGRVADYRREEGKEGGEGVVLEEPGGGMLASSSGSSNPVGVIGHHSTVMPLLKEGVETRGIIDK